jgi:UDP-N-acetylmuramoylalanine--D-glutamate ligase
VSGIGRSPILFERFAGTHHDAAAPRSDTQCPALTRASFVSNALNLHGKNILVMGLGRFGGGVGVTRFLAARGARVTVTDLAPADQLKDSAAKLAGLPVTLRLGEHRTEDFTSADLIVVNPAVDARGNAYLASARAKGVPLTSEIRLLIQSLPSRKKTIGVTGSAGKSTTTAMISHILGKLLGPERVHVGGNLGGSLLGELDRIGADEWIVLELSSFMLEGMSGDGWSPHIAVVTNVVPNHLDRHGSLEGLARAKQVILEYQTPDDFAILGPVPRGLILPRTTRVRYLEGLDTYTPRPAFKLLIPGEHNLANARLAVEAVSCAGLDRFAAVRALDDFPGLPHRLQLVAQQGADDATAVRYYNDSKATTPEAAILALRSFPPGKVHAILGGYDKKSDLTELAHVAAAHCRAIYTIGATGDAIADEATEWTARQGGLSPPAQPIEIIRCTILDRAVADAAARVRQGDVVLLTPGCASWDQFTNYEARGHAFVGAVLKHTGEGSRPPGA